MVNEFVVFLYIYLGVPSEEMENSAIDGGKEQWVIFKERTQL